MEKYKKYLGDSVYFDFDGHHIVLTTDNGLGPSNSILLDSKVMESFLLAYNDLQGRLWAEKPKANDPTT